MAPSSLFVKNLSGGAGPDLSTLGKRLAQARRELGVREGVDLTPPMMAERVGVSAPTYWRWERDERRPTTPALMTVARELGVSMDWLLAVGDDKGGEGESSPSPAPKEPPQTRVLPKAPTRPISQDPLRQKPHKRKRA